MNSRYQAAPSSYKFFHFHLKRMIIKKYIILAKESFSYLYELT